MTPQEYCLRWKHHHSNVQSMFAQLLEKERFCDVTLYCSPSFASQIPNKETVESQNIRGVSLRAHRVVLAACSELLGSLLGAHEAHGEPVLVIDGAEPKHLRALLDYMYTGEMNVHHSQLASLLKTAEELRIKGLTDIRWNNKDEPPDYEGGIITTSSSIHTKVDKQIEAKLPPKHGSPKHGSPKHGSPKHGSPKHGSPKLTSDQELHLAKKEDNDCEAKNERFNLNGGPPPLIKLPFKEKHASKRDNSDSDSPSPKRQRVISGTEHTDDDSASITKSERDQEWQHGNLDISAERVVGWGMATDCGGESTSREPSDDEWADAPTDIGSFLHTKLRVDGDNSADEESNESAPGRQCQPMPLTTSSVATTLGTDIQIDLPKSNLMHYASRPTVGPKSGPTDPRFTDVVKLSDYLQHGRRPQFWEEHYVKRVMEAVRLKELEMKQAAEILGVSYGTLYGRYRDVYGCINRPYSNVGGGRSVREFWQTSGPSEVLDRLQRGELSLDGAAQAMGVTIANLTSHIADFGLPDKGTLDFEPIPIEIDPSLKNRCRTFSGPNLKGRPSKPITTQDKALPAKKVVVGSVTDEDTIPATVITALDVKSTTCDTNAANLVYGMTYSGTKGGVAAPGGKWPSIRVASLDTLRGTSPPGSTQPASPSQLMRTRPDLTIVAAKKSDSKKDEDST